jgi:type IV pilus assembly protein PilA
VGATVVSAVGLLMLPVLAAVAIPTFLAQRERARDAAVESELREAAVAMEVGGVEEGVYGDLTGFAPGQPDVTVTLVATDGLSYCLAGSHALGGTTSYLDSTTGTVSEVPCG